MVHMRENQKYLSHFGTTGSQKGISCLELSTLRSKLFFGPPPFLVFYQVTIHYPLPFVTILGVLCNFRLYRISMLVTL